MEITENIKVIYKLSHRTYGSPRITEALRRRNIFVSRPRVARLMKAAQISCKKRKRFIATTDSKHNFPIADNKLNRKFQPAICGKAWVSDITYISTKEGWLYLTTVMDLADRKVIGWSLSDTMKAMDTSIPAFKMAEKNRPITAELIFHSDRGVQYACTEFKSLLESKKNIIRSMSRKGNCWDNAVAESFFKSLKSELIYRTKFTSRNQASVAIFEYIEIWYNKQRLHSTLGYRTPEEMEKYLSNKKLAA
jgi:transposase InsO family protein